MGSSIQGIISHIDLHPVQKSVIIRIRIVHFSAVFPFKLIQNTVAVPVQGNWQGNGICRVAAQFYLESIGKAVVVRIVIEGIASQ